MPVAQVRCKSCLTEIQAAQAAVILERRIKYVTHEGDLVNGHEAEVMLRLCLPCAWRHMEKIEEYIEKIVADDL